MSNKRHCIRCEMEGKEVRGDYRVLENAVGGRACMCKKHYEEWTALKELIPITDGNNSAENINNQHKPCTG